MQAVNPHTDREIEQLWQSFGNTPITDSDETDAPFLHFETGTDKFEIWHWFDANHTMGVEYLITL